MNTQEAYIEGFCKVAEAYGVDPEELYKQAQLGIFKVFKPAFKASRIAGAAEAVNAGVPKALQLKRLGTDFSENVKQLLARQNAARAIKKSRNIIANQNREYISSVPKAMIDGQNPLIRSVSFGEGAQRHLGYNNIMKRLSKLPYKDQTRIIKENAAVALPRPYTRPPDVKDLVNMGKTRLRNVMRSRGNEIPGTFIP